MELKTILGLLPVGLAIPSYWLYIRSIYKGDTVPHMYSWLIWSLLAGIGFAGQVSGNAGPGAWNTGITAVVCFIIFVIAIEKGDRRLTTPDKVLLAVAFGAIVVRVLTKSAETATLLATLAASVGFILTFKKAYHRPKQENPVTFFVNSLRNFISLFALNSITFLTFFYPFCMMLANLSILGVIIFGRKSTTRRVPVNRKINV